MSVANLVAQLRRVVELLPLALARQAAQDLVQASETLAPLTRGSGSSEFRQVPEQIDSARQRVDQVAAMVAEVEQIIERYIGDIGAGVPSFPTAAPAIAATVADRVAHARSRVGSRRAAGTETAGEWVRSDGWSVRITSGTGHGHDRIVQFVRDQRLPPAAARLARHVEIKVAMAIRDAGLSDETVVIDREVCGTRPYDQAQPYTCDKFLPKFLPPGASLRVVQQDGTTRCYVGEEPG